MTSRGGARTQIGNGYFLPYCSILDENHPPGVVTPLLKTVTWLSWGEPLKAPPPNMRAPHSTLENVLNSQYLFYGMIIVVAGGCIGGGGVDTCISGRTTAA